MSEVKREHLAGLELAMSRMQRHLAHENVKILHDLIAQASAAPEQEPAGHFSFCHDKKKWIQQKLKGPEFAHLLTPLYTHADPSEVERLRAENNRLNGIIGQWESSLNARLLLEKQAELSKVEQKLAEAQALLRERDRLIYGVIGATGKKRAEYLSKLHDLVSATAQPAECAHSDTAQHRTGDGTPVEFCNECGKNTHVGHPAEVKS